MNTTLSRQAKHKTNGSLFSPATCQTTMWYAEGRCMIRYRKVPRQYRCPAAGSRSMCARCHLKSKESTASCYSYRVPHWFELNLMLTIGKSAGKQVGVTGGFLTKYRWNWI
jgi:hypothetical protein